MLVCPEQSLLAAGGHTSWPSQRWHWTPGNCKETQDIMRMDSSGLGDYSLWGQCQGRKLMLSRWTFDQAISWRECVLIKLRRACSAATFTSRLIVHTQSKISFLHPLQTHSEIFRWLQIFSHPDCHHSMKFHTENRKPLQVWQLNNLRSIHTTVLYANLKHKSVIIHLE